MLQIVPGEAEIVRLILTSICMETEEDVQARAEHYRPQLAAYSRALERVLEKHVVRRALYFLHAGKTAENGKTNY